MTVTKPVAVYLKDINRWRVRFLKEVVELTVGSEGNPLGVEDDGLDVGDLIVAHS